MLCSWEKGFGEFSSEASYKCVFCATSCFCDLCFLLEVLFHEQVGNRRLLTESGVTIPTEAENFVAELEDSAKTGILVAHDDILVGVLGVADPLKREASVVIEGLKKMGIQPVIVTGDNWRTARAVAQEVCIFYSQNSAKKHLCFDMI